jgi:hypothetical protein
MALLGRSCKRGLSSEAATSSACPFCPACLFCPGCLSALLPFLSYPPCLPRPQTNETTWQSLYTQFSPPPLIHENPSSFSLSLTVYLSLSLTRSWLRMGHVTWKPLEGPCNLSTMKKLKPTEKTLAEFSAPCVGVIVCATQLHS